MTGFDFGRVRRCAWLLTLALLVLWGGRAATEPAQADAISQTKGTFVDKFRQLEADLPTPNTYRTGSGAPGHAYWQQRADHVISVELDDETQRITGSQTVTYTNNSPDALEFLWLHLDQNRFRRDSAYNRTLTAEEESRISNNRLRLLLSRDSFDGGVDVTAVKDARGRDLPHTINQTLMRIDLPAALPPGQSTSFSIDWSYNIHEQDALGGRSGWELFPDGNRIYLIAQWFPRMVAYTDAEGWHNRQFLGRGEFTLEFGNYDVSITVPDDHVVSATGTLSNARDVLTVEQRRRFAEARTADAPVFIVTPEEAKANEASTPEGTRTWRFQAQNVRDFAFASSRKFIWDAQGHRQDGADTPVMAMSFYPNEGEPLWSRYSTRAILHAMKVASKYTFDYPYPTAQSVNGPVGGMEYPMISFNGPRPVTDPETGRTSYSRRTKYALISVIIHEIVHNYFPMIVNSDERQWTWMDEGMTTFVQYLAEQEWEDNYPSRRGEPRRIVGYMASNLQVPIMTNSESILQFGNNAYGKPATALNILRETVMGRELFDHAFRTFAARWKFRRPMPADFFRTMEDASGVDLDWFWRGWFYSTDHVDISVDQMLMARINTAQTGGEVAWAGEDGASLPAALTGEAGEIIDVTADGKAAVWPEGQADAQAQDASAESQAHWARKMQDAGKNLYRLSFSNKGGLVMPLILQLTYTDGTAEILRLPAEIWRLDPNKAIKTILTDKQIDSVLLDPFLETADIDTSNNRLPRDVAQTSLEAFRTSAAPEARIDVSAKLRTYGADALPDETGGSMGWVPVLRPTPDGADGTTRNPE